MECLANAGLKELHFSMKPLRLKRRVPIFCTWEASHCGSVPSSAFPLDRWESIPSKEQLSSSQGGHSGSTLLAPICWHVGARP